MLKRCHSAILSSSIISHPFNSDSSDIVGRAFKKNCWGACMHAASDRIEARNVPHVAGAIRGARDQNGDTERVSLLMHPFGPRTTHLHGSMSSTALASGIISKKGAHAPLCRVTRMSLSLARFFSTNPPMFKRRRLSPTSLENPVDRLLSFSLCLVNISLSLTHCVDNSNQLCLCARRCLRSLLLEKCDL